MGLTRAIGISSLLLAAGAPCLAGTAPAGTPRLGVVWDASAASAPQPAPVARGDVPTIEPAGPASGSEPPAPRTVAPVGTPDVPASKAAKPEGKAPASPERASPKPAPPPALDLASLEERLKETSAIGIFTKLTLKNQIDELLDQFRAYYQGGIRTSLADLRQPYDLLILKVLTLLQDADPSLARQIGESREAIWGILSDSAKFSQFRS